MRPLSKAGAGSVARLRCAALPDPTRQHRGDGRCLADAVRLDHPFADLERALRRIGARMEAWEVHASYLGALTSTNVRMGPQRLLGRILGDQAGIGESADALNASILPILGYWNHLVAEQQAGRVQLAPFAPEETPGMDEMIAFAQRRDDELLLSGASGFLATPRDPSFVTQRKNG